MKKLLLVFTVATISLSALAQTANDTKTADAGTLKNQKHEKGRDIKNNLKDLNLTADQKQQMKTLNSNLKQKMQDLKANGSITAAEQKEQRLSLLKQYKSDRDKMLTDEQKSKLQATERKHSGKETASNKRFGKALQLNLTDDQRTKIKTIGQTYKEKTAAVQKNTTLTSEQKKEQLSKLHKQHREEMSTVLTKEQQEQLKGSKRNRRSQKDV